jgi:formyl-CoA transferase
MIVPTRDQEPDFQRTVMNPIRINDEEKRAPSRAPAIGQHTDEVLGELGFTADDVDELRSAGVVV